MITLVMELHYVCMAKNEHIPPNTDHYNAQLCKRPLLPFVQKTSCFVQHYLCLLVHASLQCWSWMWEKSKKINTQVWLAALLMCPLQSAQESDTLRTELSEKVELLKADLVIYKSLMTDVSMLLLVSIFMIFRVAFSVDLPWSVWIFKKSRWAKIWKINEL